MAQANTDFYEIQIETKLPKTAKDLIGVLHY